ncbi:ligand-binding sensor domain-containing protein [Geofilum rubicundum]|uniref:DNA-binding response regulator, AraC family n=1 Tax=Geofilum rubicundum JCM 15548 TaxID=1236989 RepID=A0A0E9LW28_9BACT|nr:two-component regulator propeller domain-containing protein [Geofilum rubicundum]GAO29434.1 DNA-binding response regulator, AraC family [Geofilum rubicundum JCM 15548]
MSQKVNFLSIQWSTALVLGFLLLFLGATSSTGQKHLQFAHLTVEDGLPQNTVHSIVRDKYGFMWFGTWNGLSRYDGYQFTNYHFDPDDSTSLVNNRVHLLYKDGAGDIWVSTFDTIVCRYNYETNDFTRFNPNELPEGLQDSTYRHNAHYYYEAENEAFRWEIREHRLWQTDQKSGASMEYHSGIFSEPGLSNDIVYSIYLDETGILWVGTAMGGVNYVDVESDHFTYTPFVLEVDEHLIKAPVRTILVDADQLWLGSSANGWALTDKTTGRAEVLKPVRHPAFSSDNIRAMYLDKVGDVWMGYRMGLYRYHRDTEHIQRYHPDKVANTPYYVVSEDRSGTLWVGGFNNLLRYNRAADEFETYDLPFMETPSSVMALEFGRDGSIWAGTELSGLFRISRDPVTGDWTDTLVYARASAPGRQLPDNRVYSLLEDGLGHMWVGTGNGLCQIDVHTGAVKVFNKADGLADAYIAGY